MRALALLVVVMAAAFALAFAVGRAVGPVGPASEPPHGHDALAAA